MALAHIVLSSGCSIELSEIRMSSTYGGMLEGYPFQRWNDLTLEHLVKGAEKARPSVPVHLVEPARELPDLPAGGFGPVELLPAVTCVGWFTSHPTDPERDSVLHHSALTVLWFQEAPSSRQEKPPIRAFSASAGTTSRGTSNADDGQLPATCGRTALTAGGSPIRLLAALVTGSQVWCRIRLRRRSKLARSAITCTAYPSGVWTAQAASRTCTLDTASTDVGTYKWGLEKCRSRCG
jgi:hypothetical protein